MVNKIKFSVFYIIVFMGLVTLGYLEWGNYAEIQSTLAQQTKINNFKKEYAGKPNAIIAKLTQQLKQKPSAQGYFLLGKLYFSMQQYQLASENFQKSNKLLPNQPAILMQYAESLFFENNQKLNFQSMNLIKQVQKLEKNNLAAYNLLALNAYSQKNYRQAIEYWQAIDSVLPANSPDHKAIREAIERARGKIPHSASASRLR